MMRITEDEARIAGELYQRPCLTDEELNLAIKMTKLTLAFLSGKGIYWGLAISSLRQELEVLEGFASARK